MTTEVQTCFRHDDRRAGVRCQRCERPICPSCMHQASVGFHCPECMRNGRQRVVTARELRAGQSTPVTVSLVVVNVVVHLLSTLGSGLQRPSFSFQLDYALIGIGRSAQGLIGVAEGEWYRLISGGFLHGSLLHLGFNMYILWILGKQLEPLLGRIGFLVVYFSSMLAGSLGVMLVEPRALTVGASGAVFGLFGYAVAAQYVRGVNPMKTGLGMIIGINLAFTFLVPGISIGGHVGGLIGGALAGAIHEIGRRRIDAPAAAGIATVALLGVACSVGSVVVASSLV